MPRLPSERGSAPVGVKTLEVRDDARAGRTLPVEVWYPADAAHRGQDFEEAHLDRFEVAPGLPEVAQHAVRDARPAEGPFPLVVFSHGATSHRRSSSELVTHLASHGYVVGSAGDVAAGTPIQGNVGLLGNGDLLGLPGDPTSSVETNAPNGTPFSTVARPNWRRRGKH